MKELQQPSLWLEIMRDREKVEMEFEKQQKCSSGSDYEEATEREPCVRRAV